MKFKFPSSIPLVVSLLFLLSSCASTITQQGLVSFYPFNGNAKDHAGNNNGKGLNVRYETKSKTSSDQVLVLNGVDSYVDLTSPFDYEEMTVSLWFTVRSVDSDFDLIYTADFADQKYGLVNLATKMEDGVSKVYFNLSGQIVSREVKTGVWYHAALVKKKERGYEYYFNGSLIASGTMEKYLSSVRGFPVAQIGTIRTREVGFFDGAVNNLRVYNRALPDNEVLALANER